MEIDPERLARVRIMQQPADGIGRITDRPQSGNYLGRSPAKKHLFSLHHKARVQTSLDMAKA